MSTYPPSGGAAIPGRVGEPVVQDQPPVASEPTVVPPQDPVSKPTAINIPDSEQIGQSDVFSPPVDPGLSSTDQVIVPGPLLKTVLVPIAAIVTGISLAILNRMRGHLPKGQDNTASDDDHG